MKTNVLSKAIRERRMLGGAFAGLYQRMAEQEHSMSTVTHRLTINRLLDQPDGDERIRTVANSYVNRDSVNNCVPADVLAEAVQEYADGNNLDLLCQRYGIDPGTLKAVIEDTAKTARTAPLNGSSGDGESGEDNETTIHELLTRHSQTLEDALNEATVPDTVATLALEMVRTVEQTAYAAGREPAGVPGGCLYAAARAQNSASLTQERVAEILGISETAVRTNYCEVAALYVRDVDEVDAAVDTSLRRMAAKAKEVTVDDSS